MPITLDPPATGDFTITLNTPNGANDTDSLKLAGAVDANILRGYLKALPGGDFTATVKVTGSAAVNFNGFGLIFRDSAGKYVNVGVVHDTTGLVIVEQWSDHTTFNAQHATARVGASEWPTWFRATFTSATSDIQGAYSYTGDNWVNLGAANTYLGTCDAYGIATYHSNASTPPIAWFEHFATA